MSDNEAWRSQLVQLNERARAYTAQQWQVPLAYVAIVGVAAGDLVKEGNELPGVVGLFALGIVGGFLRWHMLFNRRGAARAVCWIQKAEKKLDLHGHHSEEGEMFSANYRPWAHSPLEWMVSLVALGSALGGLAWLSVCPACVDWILVGTVVVAIELFCLVVIEFMTLWKAKAKWEEDCEKIVVGKKPVEADDH